MRAKLIAFLLLAFFLAPLAEARIIGKRNKRPKTRRPPVARLQPGPKYEKAALPPLDMQQVQDVIADQKPGSPTEIAAQGVMGQAPCGDSAAKQQFEQLMARVNALTAEALSLANQSVSASYQCAPPPIGSGNCTLYNKIITRIPQISAELLTLTPQLQALQAMAGSGNCGGSSPMALPPGMNRDAVAKKFKFRFPGGGGGAASFEGGMNLPGLDGEAMQQLEELAEMDGTNAGYAMDGRRILDKFRQQMGRYHKSAAAAGALGARVNEARERERQAKEEGDDSPSGKAEREYFRINYAELGPKYKALVQERGEAARSVAEEALSAPAVSAAAVLPQADEKPAYAQLAQAGVDIIKEEGLNKIQEDGEDALKTTLSAYLGKQRTEALFGIRDITQAAAENVSFDQDWKDAISQMASGSTSTGAIDKLVDKLDAGLKNTGDKSWTAFKNVFGGE